MHHHFASKFLVESLNSHGFCSSYVTVQKYECSAAVNPGTDIFHGIGIIAVVTPTLENKHIFPKRVVTAEEIANTGKIETHDYIPTSTKPVQLLYNSIQDLNVKDVTSNLDLLCRLTVPIFRSPRPGW